MKLVIMGKLFFGKILKVTSRPAFQSYLFKVNNRKTRARFEICLELTIKTQE